MAETSTRASIVMRCTSTPDCTNITNSVCLAKTNICGCDDNLPVLITSIQECIRPAALNATCTYDSQCSYEDEYATCHAVKKVCACVDGHEIKSYLNVGLSCVTESDDSGSSNVDPAMIGVLAGLALMFVIICVVLRLFSKARFRETRSIFNTPNPRLMNASLFKDSKLLSPARGDRRGSRISVRGPPSRAPSVTSVNKDSGAGRSPNESLIGKGRRGSTLSTASATGSAAAAAPPSARTPSPSSEEKHPKETTVAIETVD